LTQRDCLSVVQRDLQISQRLQRSALLFGCSCGQVSQVNRVPDLADYHSAGNGVEGFGEGFGADAELPDPVLVDLDVQVLHRLVQVEIAEPRIRVLPNCLGDEKRCLTGALRRRTADAVLQRPADWRPQFQRVNPGIETGELAVERLFQTRPDNLTLL